MNHLKSGTATSMEQALVNAAATVLGSDHVFEAHYNPESRDLELYVIARVIEDDRRTPTRRGEITLADAQAKGLHAEAGDELLFRIYYLPEHSSAQTDQDFVFGSVLQLRPTAAQLAAIAAVLDTATVSRTTHSLKEIS